MRSRTIFFCFFFLSLVYCELCKDGGPTIGMVCQDIWYELKYSPPFYNLANATRIMLVLRQQSFYDDILPVNEYFTFSAKNAIKFEQVPILKVESDIGYSTIIGTKTIEEYVAHKYNLNGRTNKEQQLINSIYQSIFETRALLNYYPSIIETDEKQMRFEELFIDIIPNKFQQWQNFSFKYGSATQLVDVAEDFSLADCVFTAFSSSLLDIAPEAMHEIFYNFPRLRSIFDAVNDSQGVRLLNRLPSNIVKK